MKAFRVRYTPEAASLIRKLHPEIKRRIRGGIKTLLENPLSGHELRFELSGFRSHRVKNYRIIYRLNDPEGFLEILFVGQRRDVYESLRALLLEKSSD
ncbi:MAG: type II toxin-antitoxin system RelE/ParE family toxin [Nitrospirae bacterium]|nr:type II toxin-antitoxin system RelE/ParE family toxin [Nitrospirota bacterium]